MSNAREQPRSLAEILKQVAIDRKTAARRKGGRIRGLQQARKKALKNVRICNAVIQLIEEGEPERGLNKKIAKRLNLPYEYVMKFCRTLDKE